MAGTIERRDVNSLPGPWHDVLRAYALAVGAMSQLPETDPRSWAYQAQVHGVGSPFDPPPDDFRSQCQHNCWYFLPWHRWYLNYFEQIIRSELRTIDEVPDDVAETWALPYWNYARQGAQTIPPEFGEPTLWNGQDNPLLDPTRDFGVNDRTAALNPLVTQPRPGVLEQPFTSSSQFVATFAGTASGWHHFREPGSVAGGLEATPHNNVHGFINGNMGDFATAGLDPLFWLHHCNIDRYWEVRGHADDPAGAWANVTFRFRDATGAAVDVNADGCVDTVGQLGYRYDDTTPPTPRTPGDAARVRRSAMVPPTLPPELPPEVVGTRGAVQLQGTRVDAPMQVGQVSPQFRDARAGQAAPRRVFLTIENIRGEVNPGISYGVYLEEVADENLAGLISFFGIEGTVNGVHALGYTFDVTDIVQALRDDDAWNPNDVHVLFEPVGAVYELEAMPTTDRPPVEVGTISISYQ